MERQIVIPARAESSYSAYFLSLNARFMQDVVAGASVIPGPTYHIATSFGTNLAINQIETIAIRPDGSQFKRYYLLAFDETSGELVGQKDGELSVPKLRRLSPIQAGNTLTVTAVRGEGVSTCLELVHAFYLQQQANTLKRKISWKAINGNMATLGIVAVLQAKKFLNAQFSSQSLTELEHKIDEQAAWQHVWGDNGILGMRGNRRTFRPNGSSIISATDIWLERTPLLPNGQVNVKVVKAA